MIQNASLHESPLHKAIEQYHGVADKIVKIKSMVTKWRSYSAAGAQSAIETDDISPSPPSQPAVGMLANSLGTK